MWIAADAGSEYKLIFQNSNQWLPNAYLGIQKKSCYIDYFSVAIIIWAEEP